MSNSTNSKSLAISSSLVLDYAKKYINAGFSVHPCRGKIPKISRWQEKTLTLSEFKSYYKEGDNIGVVMGQKSLMVCVDIDPKNGGLDWYNALKDDLGNPLVEVTGSGGLHLYYKYPIGVDSIQSKLSFVPGVDILADGGKQVVTAPSIHDCGGEYVINDFYTLLDVYDYADTFPTWLLKSLSTGKYLPKQSFEIPTLSSESLAINLAIDRIKDFPPAIQGRAGDTQTFKAASLLWDLGLTHKEALNVLMEHYNPRCMPSWSEGDIKKKIINAYKYTTKPFGTELPENQFEVETPLEMLEPKEFKASEISKESKAPLGQKPKKKLDSINIRDFRHSLVKPKEHLIGPFVRQGLSMVYAPPGVGKTHFALGIAFAVSTGGSFLKWKTENMASVLYIDGELPAHILQDRIAPLVDAVSHDMPINFEFITPDRQEEGVMPDIATIGGQAALKEHVDRADFIVVDNISSLVRSGKENEAESWIPVQDWALGLRRAGKSVLFVHHSGKGEGASPRGTSKREDVMDLIIGLSHPAGWEADKGCEFEVKFRKARNFRNAEEIRSFQAKYVHTEFSSPSWEVIGIDERNSDKIEQMSRDGVSQKDIADELGISKQYVSKVVKNLGFTPGSAKGKGRIDSDSDF